MLALSPLTSPADGALPCPQSRRPANTSRSPAGAGASATAAVQDGDRRRRTGLTAVWTSGRIPSRRFAIRRSRCSPTGTTKVAAAARAPVPLSRRRIGGVTWGHGRGRVLRMEPFRDLQDPSPTSTPPSRSHPKVEIFASRARVDTTILCGWQECKPACAFTAAACDGSGWPTSLTPWPLRTS
ncbi:uncharacterized protein [Lolium perenne]|uniref:uncharacterized protein isoform X2 n=1 Tax=Lolium perenne TaxID=4522 RepID=UPI003A98EB90